MEANEALLETLVAEYAHPPCLVLLRHREGLDLLLHDLAVEFVGHCEFRAQGTRPELARALRMDGMPAGQEVATAGRVEHILLAHRAIPCDLKALARMAPSRHAYAAS